MTNVYTDNRDARTCRGLYRGLAVESRIFLRSPLRHVISSRRQKLADPVRPFPRVTLNRVRRAAVLLPPRRRRYVALAVRDPSKRNVRFLLYFDNFKCDTVKYVVKSISSTFCRIHTAFMRLNADRLVIILSRRSLRMFDL